MTSDAARRTYRRLLRIAPRHLRERYSAEIEDAFIANWERARGAGRLWAWTRAAADLAAARFVFPNRRLTRRERTRLMLATEFRAAWRSFGRQRAATALVLLMLALGISANVVVFSLVNGVFLQPFPFPNPERLMYVNETAPAWNLEETSVDFSDFAQWRKGVTAFESIALYNDREANLSDARGAERVTGARISQEFFSVLKVDPLVGRVFTAEETVLNGPRVVILSEGLWRDRFGGDAGVLGRTLSLNGESFAIVGVMPRRAEFPDRAAFWVPIQVDPNGPGRNYTYDAIARVKPGVTAEAAERDLLRAHAPVWDSRDPQKLVTPFLRPLRERFVRDLRSVAGALSTAVVLLLTVACANVAAVMLARAIARRREIGIRLAIGASRARLVLQLFIENLILAAAGGAIGVLAGRWALRVLVTSVPDLLPAWVSFDVDWRVALFSVSVTAAAALVFGWLPAFHAVRGDLRGAMHDAAAGATPSPRGRRTLTALVAAEFLLAAVLLAGTGLLFRAFRAIERLDPGYAADHVLMFSASLPSVTYPGDARAPFWDKVLARLRAAPGVTAAGIASCPPLTCHLGNLFNVEARAPKKPGEIDPIVLTRFASDGYFEAMGIRLASGRFFNARDGLPGGLAPIIVNESFVRTYWPGDTQVLGKRLSFNYEKDWTNVVVGVTRDVKHYGLDQPIRPGVYFPSRQMSARMSTPVVVIRTAADPLAFAPTARAIMREMDPSLPLFRMSTAEQLLADRLQTRRTYSWMLVVFAGITLLLALGGTYGVTSYLVAQRGREIGIRIAIGARAADITGAVFRSSLPAIFAGVGVGLALAAYAARHMADLLFGISPQDPAVLAAAAGALALTGILANWIPARRAAKTNPISSLKS
jgi:putative ABC transport system permease protein